MSDTQTVTAFDRIVARRVLERDPAIRQLIAEAIYGRILDIEADQESARDRDDDVAECACREAILQLDLIAIRLLNAWPAPSERAAWRRTDWRADLARDFGVNTQRIEAA